MPKYKLLKDLPSFAAGEIFYWDEEQQLYVSENVCIDGTKCRWPRMYVENRPKWFEEVKETPYKVTSMYAINPSYHKYEIYFNKKCEDIRGLPEAIEDFLNKSSEYKGTMADNRCEEDKTKLSYSDFIEVFDGYLEKEMLGRMYERIVSKIKQI